jgi:hypothetical protein
MRADIPARVARLRICTGPTVPAALDQGREIALRARLDNLHITASAAAAAARFQDVGAQAADLLRSITSRGASLPWRMRTSRSVPPARSLASGP